MAQLRRTALQEQRSNRFVANALCQMADWWSYLSIFDPTDPENFEVGLIILATIWFLVSCVDCVACPGCVDGGRDPTPEQLLR
eukprot:COSAG02_NODE_7997_length_2754_cov_2.457627_2_plen_83_part_00